MRTTAGKRQKSVWRRHTLRQTVNAQRAWRQLSDMWLLWSGQLVQLCPKNNELSEATVNAENSKMPVSAAEPITELAISRNGKATEMADRLRLRLALSEMNDA